MRYRSFNAIIRTMLHRDNSMWLRYDTAMYLLKLAWRDGKRPYIVSRGRSIARAIRQRTLLVDRGPTSRLSTYPKSATRLRDIFNMCRNNFDVFQVREGITMHIKSTANAMTRVGSVILTLYRLKLIFMCV